jgi:large subunit ribosomal protein L16
MLSPKKPKYRKWQTGRKNIRRINAPETRGLTVAFGSHGLKATTAARVTSNQLEAARKVIIRSAGKVGRVWIRVFPDRPFTAKPAEVGMGSGKGDLQGYVFEVRPGRVLFEVEAANPAMAREALRKGGTKLPLRTKIVERTH